MMDFERIGMRWRVKVGRGLKLSAAGKTESGRNALPLPSFPCHPFPAPPPALLPLLKESSFALQLTVLFLVLCATCCLKTQLQLLVHQRHNTQPASKVHLCAHKCGSDTVTLRLSQVTWLMGEGVCKYGWSVWDADLRLFNEWHRRIAVWKHYWSVEMRFYLQSTFVFHI